MRIFALVIGIIWAGFWIYFGLASGISEGLNISGIIIHSAIPGLIFLIGVAIAWKWKLAGGILLIFQGIIVGVGYPLMAVGKFPSSTIIFVMITMALPPIIIGMLFIKDKLLRGDY